MVSDHAQPVATRPPKGWFRSLRTRLIVVFSLLERVLQLVGEIKPSGILIADDDPDFVASIREVLEDNGYAVYVARDGREALDRVRADGIDVLILDLHLPMLSGLEVYLELKRSGHALPTIIVTGYAREKVEAIDALRRMSVTGILTKPFDPAALLEMVARISGQ
jgi:CheY-like chemotaxis protein